MQPAVSLGQTWRDPRKRALIVAAGLAPAMILAYMPAMQGEFLWDDNVAIGSNAMLRSWAGLWRIWTDPTHIAGGVYWPVTLTTFWVEYQLWGADLFGYHFTNLLLHMANTFLLFALLRRLEIPGAAAATALFGLHPLHVESVAWIIERKDVLSGFFYLSALLCYLRFDATRRAGAYGGALLLFAAAMLSKSMVVTFPVAVAIILWWKRGRLDLRRDAAPLAPFLAAGLALSLAIMHWEHQVRDMSTGLSFLQRSLLAGRSLWHYAGQAFFPWPLMAIQPQEPIDAGAWRTYTYSLAWAAGLVVLFAGRRRWGRGPFAAALLYTCTLGPVLGFFDFGMMEFAWVGDRFQYLAVAAPLCLACSGFARLGAPRAGAGVAVLLCLVCAGYSRSHSALFRDSERLFAHNLKYNPDSHRVRDSYGSALLENGKVEEAVVQFRTALELRPGNLRALMNLGNAYVRLERYDEALRAFAEAVGIDPELGPARHNLALCYQGRGDLALAALHFEKAVEIAPDWPDPAIHLARILSTAGDASLRDGPRAVLLAERANRNTGFSEAFHLGVLASAYAEAGRFEDAVEAARRATEILRAGGKEDAARTMEGRIEFYRQGKRP